VNVKVKAHIALATVALIYGVNYVVAKSVLTSGLITSQGFIMLRVIFATILLWILHSMTSREKLDRSDFLYAAMCSIFGIAVNQLCFFKGLELTSPMHASLIMIIVPIIVLLGSYFILKDKVTVRQTIGILLGLAGAAVLIWSAGKHDKISSLRGDIFILINAISYALYLIFAKRLLIKYHPITVMKWLFLIGTVFIIQFGMGDMLQADYTSMTTAHFWSIGYVLLCTTFLAYVFNAYALGILKPSTLSFYIYFQPLIASFISILLGNDSLDFLKVQAAVLLFIGVYLVTQGARRKAGVDK
jgi:drug/metabolite transporter (DMT)-like permease